MLEGLDAVAWETLELCYEPATRIPESIRALTSERKETSDSALQFLYDNLTHQGTVYSGTAHAIPFLIELLKQPSLPHTAMLLDLLSNCAYAGVYGNYAPYTPLLQSNDFDPMFDYSQRFGWDPHPHAAAAVSTGVPIYLRLLQHSDPSIRMSAAYVLAVIPQRAREIIPTMCQVLGDESLEMVKASLLLSLGCIWPDDMDVGFFTPWLDATTSMRLQIVAALGLARITKSSTGPRVVTLLCEAVRQAETVDPWYTTLKWSNGDSIIDHSCMFLGLIGSAKAAWTIPILAARVDSLWLQAPPSRWAIGHVLDCMFKLAFPERDTPLSIAALTQEQQTILKYLIDYPYTWYTGDIEAGLRRAGLPSTWNDLLDSLRIL